MLTLLRLPSLVSPPRESLRLHSANCFSHRVYFQMEPRTMDPCWPLMSGSTDQPLRFSQRDRRVRGTAGFAVTGSWPRERLPAPRAGQRHGEKMSISSDHLRAGADLL